MPLPTTSSPEMRAFRRVAIQTESEKNNERTMTHPSAARGRQWRYYYCYCYYYYYIIFNATKCRVGGVPVRGPLFIYTVFRSPRAVPAAVECAAYSTARRAFYRFYLRNAARASCRYFSADGKHVGTRADKVRLGRRFSSQPPFNRWTFSAVFVPKQNFYFNEFWNRFTRVDASKAKRGNVESQSVREVFIFEYGICCFHRPLDLQREIEQKNCVFTSLISTTKAVIENDTMGKWTARQTSSVRWCKIVWIDVNAV